MENVPGFIRRLYDKAVVFCVATYVCLPFFSNNYVTQSDIGFHSGRVRSTIAGLRDGQIIPQIDPNSFDGAGAAYNLFYGPLATYFVTFFRIFTPTWALAINLTIYSGVLVSGFVMYKIIYIVCGRYSLSSDSNMQSVASALGTVVFLTGNSILVHLYFGVYVGSLWATAFALLGLLGFLSILYEKRGVGGYYIAVGGAGIILCHTISAIIFSTAFVFILVMNLKNIYKNGKWKNILVGLIGAVGLSAFFTIPMLENLRANYLNVNLPYFAENFQNVSAEGLNRTRKSLSNVLFDGTFTEFFGLPGILFVTVTILFIVVVAYQKYNRIYISFHITLFMMLFVQSDQFDWELLPSIFYTLQYVHRISYIVNLLAAICLAFSVFILAKHIRFNRPLALTAIGIIGLLIFTNATLTAQKSTIFTDSDFDYAGHMHTPELALGEYLPTNLATCNKPIDEVLNAADPDDPHTVLRVLREDVKCHQQRGDDLLVSPENETLANVEVNGSHTDFDIATNSYTTVELPKTYYLGYRATGATDTETINFDTFESANGWVAVNIPEGFAGHIKVWYGMTALSILGGCITLITILLLLFYGIYTKRAIFNQPTRSAV